MRLRSRRNTSGGDLNGAASPAVAASTSRIALGNIDPNKDGQEQKSIRPKPSGTGIVERLRRGRSRPSNSAKDQLALGQACKNKPTVRSDARDKKGKKETTTSKKKKGVKRTSSNGANSKQQTARSSKRSKSSDVSTVVTGDQGGENFPAVSQRVTRSRSATVALQKDESEKCTVGRGRVSVDTACAQGTDGDDFNNQAREFSEVVPKKNGAAPLISPAEDQNDNAIKLGQEIMSEEKRRGKKGDKVDSNRMTLAALPSIATSYQYSAPADDIDVADSDDPGSATYVLQEMYDHFRQKEIHTSVRPSYMDHQQYLNERMRSILIDWLIEVHLKFKFVPETLYLTVNVIDRYLAKAEVSRPKLQLLGATAFLIASKYEEIYPVDLRDLVYICDRAYSKVEIIDFEEIVLAKLEYRVTVPSAHTFLVRYLKAAHTDKKIVQISCYILEGTLVSYNLLRYLPSQLAAAAVYIARRTVGRNGWSPTLLKYTQYHEEDIKLVARAVLDEKSGLDSLTRLRAVAKKYASAHYGSVATIPIHSEF